MELVQIIYDILLFGGSILVIVIAISFLLSRKNKNDLHESITNTPSVIATPQFSIPTNKEQIVQRWAAQPPIIYQIEPRPNRELKILRKPTVTKKEIQERIIQEENMYKRTNGLNRRYTIVNDVMSKSFNKNAINY